MRKYILTAALFMLASSAFTVVSADSFAGTFIPGTAVKTLPGGTIGSIPGTVPPGTVAPAPAPVVNTPSELTYEESLKTAHPDIITKTKKAKKTK